jgi:uracil phosphoribosyltransferase
LVENSLVALRDVTTGTESFRRHARSLSQILAFYVLEDLPMRQVTVRTPLEDTPDGSWPAASFSFRCSVPAWPCWRP